MIVKLHFLEKKEHYICYRGTAVQQQNCWWDARHRRLRISEQNIKYVYKKFIQSGYFLTQKKDKNPFNIKCKK